MINIGRYRIVSCSICTLYIIYIYLYSSLWNLNQGRINRGGNKVVPPLPTPLEFYPSLPPPVNFKVKRFSVTTLTL